MVDEFEQPWDVIADYFTNTGFTLSEARDRVTLAWLRDGNIDPYCDWVMRGHLPSNRVVMLIARMMQKAKQPQAIPLADLTCGITIYADGRKLPDKEGEVRKFLAARYSMSLEKQAINNNKKVSLKRFDAIAADRASDIQLANNITIGHSTVRQVRMQLQRDIENGEIPTILRSLICLD